MDCNNLRELLINTIYETLDEDTAKEVNAHLEACITCRRQVEEARALLKGYQEVPKPTPPQGAIAAALEAGRKARIEMEEKKKTRRIVRDSSLRKVIQSPAMATAALFLIIITIFFYSNDTDKEYTTRMAKVIDRDRNTAIEGEALMPTPEAIPPQPITEEPAKLKVIAEVNPRRARLEADTDEISAGTTLVEAEEVPPPSEGNATHIYLGISQTASQAVVVQTETIPEETLAEASSPTLMTSKEFLWKGTADEDETAPVELKSYPVTAPVDKGETVAEITALEIKKSSLEAEDFKQVETLALQRPPASSPSLAKARGVTEAMESIDALQRSRMAGTLPIPAIPTPALTARIWTEQEKVPQEMPIIIHYEIKNTGSEDAILWLTGFWPNHRIEVLDQDGKPVVMTEAGKKRLEAFEPQGEKNQDASLSLAPGEADTGLTSYDLREFFNLDNPGPYTVRYLLEEGAPGGWQGQLWSNYLTIQVTE